MKLTDLTLFRQFGLLVETSGVMYTTDAQTYTSSVTEALNICRRISIPMSTNKKINKEYIKASTKYANTHLLPNCPVLTIVPNYHNDGICVDYFDVYTSNSRILGNDPVTKFSILRNMRFVNQDINKVCDMLHRLVTAVSNITELNEGLIEVIKDLYDSTPKINTLESSVYDKLDNNYMLVQHTCSIFTMYGSGTEEAIVKYQGDNLTVSLKTHKTEKLLLKELVSGKANLGLYIVDENDPTFITQTMIAEIIPTGKKPAEVRNSIVAQLEVIKKQSKYTKLIDNLIEVIQSVDMQPYFDDDI